MVLDPPDLRRPALTGELADDVLNGHRRSLAGVGTRMKRPGYGTGGVRVDYHVTEVAGAGPPP